MQDHDRNRPGRLAGLFLAAVAWVAAGCQEEAIEPPNAPLLQQVHTVAVLPFVDAPQAKGSGDVVVNAAIASLYQCQGIRVVERGRLDAILKEKDLKIADLVDPDVATKIGKLAGADAMVMGEVTQYEAQQDFSSLTVYSVTGSGTKFTHRVGLSVRMVSMADGQVIYAELGQGTSKDGYSDAAKQAATEALKPLRSFLNKKRAGPKS